MLRSIGRQYDAFVFGFKSQIVHTDYDLKYLADRGKKVIWVFHGSDARPAYVSGWHAGDSSSVAARLKKRVRRQKELIRTIEQHVDHVVNLELTAHLSERPHVSWLDIGIPCEPPDEAPERKRRSGGPVRILHCPSNRKGKGTLEIRKSINTLRERGYSIDYGELSGVTNSEVLTQLEQCHFVIDQVYSDTPMAGFATEAAMFGKPAVVGSYAVDYYPTSQELGAGAWPPSLFCHPRDLTASIERLFRDIDFRQTLGDQARQFVCERWSAERVASRFLRLLDDDVPREWIRDPHDIRYVHGAGVPEREAKRAVRAVVESGDESNLMLDDKPELRSAFVEFAFSESDSGEQES